MPQESKPKVSKAAVISTIITLGALAAAGARLLWPTLPLDSIVVALIVIAVVPWIGPIFKSIEIPGLGKVEFPEQATTRPPAPQVAAAVRPTTLSPQARKILATLWQHQRKLFRDDYSKRWTFTVFPSASEFPNYLSGVTELVKAGLVSIIQPPEQAAWHSALTNDGVDYARSDPSLETETNVYRF